ncbi:MAG: DUF4124 domain-containing protein [Steroidobacteraceae bacterium]
MSRTLTACLLTVAALLASPVGADVYKFKDEQGNVLYTDKPSTLPAERINVQSQKTDTVAVQARQQEEMKRLQAASGTGQQQQTPDQQAGQQQPAQDSGQDQADRCAKARARYDNYMNSQKLYEQQANGERRYLTDAEIEAARASAKTSMDVLCK